MLWIYNSCVLVHKPTINEDLLTSYTIASEYNKQELVYTEQAIRSSVELYTNVEEYSFMDVLANLFGSIKKEVFGFFGYGVDYMQFVSSKKYREDEKRKEIESLGQYRDQMSGMGMNMGKGNSISNISNHNINNSVNNVIDTEGSFTKRRKHNENSNSNTNTNTNQFSNDYDTGNDTNGNGSRSMSLRSNRQGVHDRLRDHSSVSCQCAYYLLLNIGARYVASISDTSNRVEIALDSGKWVVGILVAVPLLLLFNFATTFLGYTCVCPNSYGFDPWFVGLNCTAEYILVLGTGLTVTLYIVWTMVVVSVLVSIFGMAYGSIIMHKMAQGWVARYKGLRLCKSDDSGSAISEIGLSSANTGGTGSGGWVGGSSTNNDNINSSSADTTYAFDNENGNGDDDSDGDGDDTHTHTHTHTHIQNKCDMIAVGSGDNSTSRSQLSLAIKRDAYEQYLFIGVGVYNICIYMCIYAYVYMLMCVYTYMCM